jgi:hypothetical protein
MRWVFASVLVSGLLVALCASADAGPAHRPRARSHVPVPPGQGASAPAATGHFAVPGWSNEDTRRWLDGAGALWRGA